MSWESTRAAKAQLVTTLHTFYRRPWSQDRIVPLPFPPSSPQVIRGGKLFREIRLAGVVTNPAVPESNFNQKMCAQFIPRLTVCYIFRRWRLDVWCDPYATASHHPLFKLRWSPFIGILNTHTNQCSTQHQFTCTCRCMRNRSEYPRRCTLDSRPFTMCMKSLLTAGPTRARIPGSSNSFRRKE